MFYKTKTQILDKGFVVIGEALVDLQPYERQIGFEEKIVVDVTHRAFTNGNKVFTIENYLLIGDSLYKIMSIKRWDVYTELRLAYSERGLPDETD